MSKVRLVVVGNGMVGHRFIEELIERADPVTVHRDGVDSTNSSGNG